VAATPHAIFPATGGSGALGAPARVDYQTGGTGCQRGRSDPPLTPAQTGVAATPHAIFPATSGGGAFACGLEVQPDTILN